ncbi:hypothetical protein [Mesorhizobium onobrychidis]|uniref:Uncharacterized protein n=1 Tax=Mesorhizobium onobrychidis TaxID=2775404 RepID=A0ABY5R8R4_9HYPH|nr:hypothetical protein [Mesorhizobium onobrychidis]UVC19372.1 hypothetical protein IHQ72_35505 [Mesorhizobium onobrychidis]
MMKRFTLELTADPSGSDQEEALLVIIRATAQKLLADTLLLECKRQPNIAVYVADMFSGVQEIDLEAPSLPDRKRVPPPGMMHSSDHVRSVVDWIRSQDTDVILYSTYVNEIEKFNFLSDDRIKFNQELEELGYTISGFATLADGTDIPVAIALASSGEQPIQLGGQVAKEEVEQGLRRSASECGILPGDQVWQYSTLSDQESPGFGMESGYAIVRGGVVVNILVTRIT